MALSGLLRKANAAFALAIFAMFSALFFVLATPVVSTVSTQGPTGSRVVGTDYSLMSLTMVVLQATAIVLVGAALFLIARSQRQAGRRVLLAGATVGLLPAVVPGVLAFAAWYVFGKAHESDR
ncbi:hypothetical protein GCM10020358_11520 [Amorphoplanes nipponensis]|uniref:Uncharacterized protein n=1 Tax=Actinoplanes nipponensis TaxID=135950 RepID=A0A919JN51_9ACTN|nr:hypothetical protein [Actinoplanes nipponensis]GIE52360.1 hypothetical protein Ani05nite_58940 [Actinoplanes nipponensis]